MRPARLIAVLALSLLGAGCASTSPSGPGAAAVAARAEQDWQLLNLEGAPCAIRKSSDGSVIAGLEDSPGGYTLLYGVNRIAHRGADGDEIQGSMKLSSARLSEWTTWDPITIQLADTEEAGIPVRGYVVLISGRGMSKFRHTGFYGELWDEAGRALATLTIDSNTLTRLLDCHGS